MEMNVYLESIQQLLPTQVTQPLATWRCDDVNFPKQFCVLNIQRKFVRKKFV